MSRPARSLVALLAVAAALLPAGADAQGRWRQRGASYDYGGYAPDYRPRGYGRGYAYDAPRHYEGREPRDYRGRGRRCDRGTGGTILGAIAGGLLGDSVAGRGDRTAGAVVGAGVGALAGRAIDRDC